MITNKQDAINEIKNLCDKFNIKIYEIKSVLRESHFGIKAKNNLLQIFLSYMSGILIFVGLCLYINVIFEELNFVAKVVITFGAGISAFLISLFSINNINYKYITTPFLLISAILEPIGLSVINDYYFINVSQSLLPIIIILSIIFLQYLVTFLKYKIHSTLFLTLSFGALSFLAISNYLIIPDSITGITLGLSLLLISFSLNTTIYKTMSPFWYFVGSIILFIAYFDLIYKSIFEISFLLITIILIYISINIHSRILIFTSSSALIIFLGYYSGEYFSKSLGLPIILIIIGLVFFIISGLIVKINKKYY